VETFLIIYVLLKDFRKLKLNFWVPRF